MDHSLRITLAFLLTTGKINYSTCIIMEFICASHRLFYMSKSAALSEPCKVKMHNKPQMLGLRNLFEIVIMLTDGEWLLYLKLARRKLITLRNHWIKHYKLSPDSEQQ